MTTCYRYVHTLWAFKPSLPERGHGLHLQAVFDSCRILDLRNATVTLGCVDLLRSAASLECLCLRSDYIAAEGQDGGTKHDELQKFIALLPVRCLSSMGLVSGCAAYAEGLGPTEVLACCSQNS